MALPTLKTMCSALKGHYTPPKTGFSLFEDDALISMLRTLPSLSRGEHIDPILIQIQKHHPGASLQPADHATIAYVDDCMTEILRKTDLGFKIEAFVRDLAPFVAMIALEQDVRAIMQPQMILSIIKSLTTECVGWSEDLGVLGDQLMDKIESTINSMIAGRIDQEECARKLNELFAREKALYEKMEESLCASELKVLISQKSKFFAAELLNQQMSGKSLSLFIICMLQGSWYELLQQIFIHCGQKSAEWKNASQLTELLINSLQTVRSSTSASPNNNLPKKISAFVASLPFEFSIDDAMADVANEYESNLSDLPSQACDFDLLTIDPTMNQKGLTIPEKIYTDIEAFQAGQWFIFDAKDDSEEKVARIKLILNWQDTDRLLFTNQNRRKIMNMSYHELAGYLSNNTVKLLNTEGSTQNVIKAHMMNIIRCVQTQKEKEIKAREARQRKLVSRQYVFGRKAEMLEALAKHKRRAKIKQQRALVLRQKAEKKRQIADQAVAGLNIDAWVKLPVMEGILTPCKLAAIIPGADKYIFTNRAGIKVADYSSRQLAQMIVTENSEILDTGTEFENVLASIVCGLREDKEKSFDELSGNVSNFQAL